MPILTLDSSFRRLIGALGLLVLTLFAIRVSLVLMPFGAATTPDSLNYLAMAEGLGQGQGASIPTVGLEAEARTTVTLWAPLYSAWIALFLPITRTVVAAAALANGAALVLLALLFQRLGQRWIGSVPASLCAGVLLLMPSMHLIFSYAWSETLCLPLLMACYLALLNYGGVSEPQAWRSGLGSLLLAALACALCIYARYASVAFIPLLLGSTIWLRPQISWRGRLALAALAGLAVAVLIAPLLVRNVILSGHLSGGDRTEALLPPASYAGGLIDSLRFYVLAGHAWLVLAWLSLYAACEGLGRLLPGRWPRAQHAAAEQSWAGASRDTRAPGNPRADSSALPLAWAAIYLLALLVMSRSQHIDNDSRMTSLIVPFIMLASLCASAGQARRFGRLAWLPLVCVMAFWAAQGAESLERVRRSWTEHFSPDFAMIGAPTQIFNNFTSSPGDPRFRALELEVNTLQNRGMGRLIFSDINPLAVTFITGASARWLPAHLDPPTLRRMNALGAQGGALLLTRAESLALLKGVYGEELRGVKRIDPGVPQDALLIALPLPVEMERVKGIEPSS